MNQSEVLDDQTLLKHTILAVVSIVGASIFFVGLVGLSAMFIVGKAVGPSRADEAPTVSEPAKIDGQSPSSPSNRLAPPSRGHS